MLIDVQDSAKDRRFRRQKEWYGILIHHTGAPTEIQYAPLIDRITNNIINWLKKSDTSYVSAHYVIKRNGVIIRLVNPDIHEAFHAGESQAFDPKTQTVLKDINQWFIGIELIGDGNKMPYTEEQYVALVNLTTALVDRYKSIRPNLITGHETVAPGRKADPGKMFDWDKFFTRFYLLKGKK